MKLKINIFLLFFFLGQRLSNRSQGPLISRPNRRPPFQLAHPSSFRSQPEIISQIHCEPVSANARCIHHLSLLTSLGLGGKYVFRTSHTHKGNVLTHATPQPRHRVLRVLLFFNRVGLCYLPSFSPPDSVLRMTSPLTTRRTDFFEDSCNSPAMINSSKIFVPSQFLISP